jgi:hypothetical protein
MTFRILFNIKDHQGSYLLTSLPNKSFAKSGFGKIKPKIGLDSQPREDAEEKNYLLTSINQHLKSTYFELKINLEPFVSFEEISLSQNYVSQKDFRIDNMLRIQSIEPKSSINRVNPSKVDYTQCSDFPKKQELYQTLLKNLEKIRTKRVNKKVFLELFARTTEGYPVLMNRFLDEHATTGLSRKKLINRKKAVAMDQEEGKIN